MTILTGKLPLAVNRHVPFVDTWTFRGIDLIDAVMKAQVKATKDSGLPLIDLNTVVTDIEGLRLVSAATVDGIMTSEVSVRINEPTLQALPLPGIDAEGEVGDDLVLFWDVHVMPSGEDKQVYLSGTFTVVAGVTESEIS